LPTQDAINAYSADFGQKSSFSLQDLRRDEKTPWSNYVRGVLDQFLKRGDHPAGMDLLVAGNVPIGAGLSSSAALEVATAETCRVLFSIDIDPVSLALLCQRAEQRVRRGAVRHHGLVRFDLGRENSALRLTAATCPIGLWSLTQESHRHMQHPQTAVVGGLRNTTTGGENAKAPSTSSIAVWAT
jgi:galactokinase